MEITKIDKDITVKCVTATSFPDGVLAAHQKLHSLVSYSNERKYYGISRPSETGEIIYKAAMTELKEGELNGNHLEEFVIRKGDFISITIHDFMNNIEGIGNAFERLTSDPRIDPQGYCLEWYYNDTDVLCMVPMK